MNAIAVVLEEPERLVLKGIDLPMPGADDVVVDIDWSGISTGTERLLWSGRMPQFPGLGYPLVPGYESVGRIREAGGNQTHRIGEVVFVPGATCFGAIRGLFGGAASRVVVPSARALPIGDGLGECGTLFALAATAYHAAVAPDGRAPELIVGHGVLGRLLARVVMALGHDAPTVWEMNPKRMSGATGYRVIAPPDDKRHDYRSIIDVSGDAGILDSLVQRLAPQGEIVLAGFYSEALSFAFPPAFMREARIRVAAEWKGNDLPATRALIEAGKLSLDGLITHRHGAKDAPIAYRTAFTDPSCLKMILDWRTVS